MPTPQEIARMTPDQRKFIQDMHLLVNPDYTGPNPVSHIHDRMQIDQSGKLGGGWVHKHAPPPAAPAPAPAPGPSFSDESPLPRPAPAPVPVPNVPGITIDPFGIDSAPFKPSSNAPMQGGALMLAPVVIPRAIMLFRGASAIINRGAFSGIRARGSGAARAIVGALGLEAVADILGFGISDMFGASAADEIGELIEELVDSGYIQYDGFNKRTGANVPMEYVVLPVGDNADREVAYGLSYRPFSRSTLNTIQQKSNVVRRRRTPRRRQS